jgi:hypothetical protein
LRQQAVLPTRQVPLCSVRLSSSHQARRFPLAYQVDQPRCRSPPGCILPSAAFCWSSHEGREDGYERDTIVLARWCVFGFAYSSAPLLGVSPSEIFLLSRSTSFSFSFFFLFFLLAPRRRDSCCRPGREAVRPLMITTVRAETTDIVRAITVSRTAVSMSTDTHALFIDIAQPWRAKVSICNMTCRRGLLVLCGGGLWRQMTMPRATRHLRNSKGSAEIWGHRRQRKLP